jgi:hypothetical protein
MPINEADQNSSKQYGYAKGRAVNHRHANKWKPRVWLPELYLNLQPLG